MPDQIVRLAFPANFGVNTAESPVPLSEKLQGRFIQQACNLRIVENRWRTGYAVRELAAQPGTDFDLWKTLHTQAALWYEPHAGQGPHYIGVGSPRIVESAAGRMFTLSLDGDTFTVLDVSGGNVSYPNMRMAWITQAENYVVRSDGKSQTQIWDGKNNVVFSPGYSSTEKTSARIPNRAGPTVYAGGRIWVVTFDRRILASNSLHQLDQKGAGDLLKFTDQTYDYINVAFTPPSDEGDIVALAVSVNAGFNDSRAQGEVLAFCRSDATWGIQLGVPRTDWPTAQMRHTRSREAGATGPWGFVVRDGDIIMRTARGLESMNLLARERLSVGNSVIDLSADIHRLIAHDDESLLLYASMVSPHRWSRLIATVSPELEGAHHFHHGWVSANWNPLSERTPSGFAWEGLSVLPSAMGKVVQFIEAKDGGRSRVFALTRKGDSKGLVEITNDEGPDVLADGTVQAKQWYLLTRKLAGGDVFGNMNIGNFWLYLEDIRTDLKIRVMVRTDVQPDFKEARQVCVEIAPRDGALPCAAAASRVISLGKPVDDSTGKPSWIQILVAGEGICTIDLAVRSSGSNNPDEQPDKESVLVPSEDVCQFDPFDPVQMRCP